jgi:hypothetical protein
MEAQAIWIALHDESAGYEASPGRVSLAVLHSFVREVDEFLRGDARGTNNERLDVAVKHGSLAIETAPTSNPGLLQDLLRLASAEQLDSLHPRRRAVVERWQRAAHTRRDVWYEIATPAMQAPVLINASSDYRSDDADQWVRVERYVQGELYEMGGLKDVNAHIRLPDGTSLVVDTDREVLGSQKVNRLFKPAMVRIVAEYNVATRQYRNARLIEFVEHAQLLDEQAMERLTRRGAKAWSDVENAADWVESLRGRED